MSDIELVVRQVGLSLLPSRYKGNLKHFLDGSQQELNRLWGEHREQIEEAIDILFETVEFVNRAFGSEDAFSLFDTDPDISGFTHRFNRAIFDSLTVGLRDARVRHELRDQLEEVKTAFVRLCTNQRYVDSVTRTTKTSRALQTRVGLWAEEVRQLAGLEVEVPRFGEGLRGADEEEE
jgi:hypothetical protein